MSRPNRILYDNAVYHIIQRGHNKDRLFKKAEDYKIFKDYVRKYKERLRFDIYHYCIMSNHFHILLKVCRGEELPKIIHGITQSYSYYYRKGYNRTGYVYQNRYKSFIIEDDSYLLECGRYIERNPLRAGIAKDLSDYRWSSYNFYAKGIKDDIITTNPLYLTMGHAAEERQRCYRDYILEPRPYEKVLDKAIIG